MAVLQAARAHVLGLPLTSAKSWGLNRAIFYAAAKRGFKGARPYKRPKAEIEETPVVETPAEYHLGNEMAFKAKGQPDGPLFTMGGKIQTIEEFERQIESRFERNFDKVWEEALGIVQEYDRSILLTQNKFFNEVYKPRRDELANKWSER